MTEKTLTTENIRPALDALRGELAPWPVVAKKQDRLNTAQLNAANSGITSSLVAQIIANTAAIRALESAITGTGLRALVVSSLPAIGTRGILYIVPVTTYDPDTDADVVNYSNEYIWIPVEGGTASEGHYEQVGQTGIVINNGQLTITVNGTSVGTFTANQSGDTTAAITVPTNADYVDLSTNQTVAGVKTFSSTIIGTASKAIADEDGTSIKSGYVNVAGNQTVSGQKTWSSLQTFSYGLIRIKSLSQEIGVTPSTSVIQYLEFADKNNVQHGKVGLWDYDNGASEIQLSISDKYNNGVKDSTGTSDTAFLSFGFQYNGTKFITFSGQVNNSVIPLATNSYSLGSSSYQWSSVYAQTYYYNGTAWGLDKANTWTGTNTFTAKNLFHIAEDPVYILKSSTMQEGVVPSGNRTAYTGNWQDKNSSVLGYNRFIFYSTASIQAYEVNIRNKATNGSFDSNGSLIQSGYQLVLYPSGNSELKIYAHTSPNGNGVWNLGDSTHKWKTLNGINPGALSLPDASNAISLDTTNVSMDGTYTYLSVSVNGWLYIALKDTAIKTDGELTFYIGDSGTSSAYAKWAVNFVCSSDGYVRCFIPVLANSRIRVRINPNGGSPTGLSMTIYPCLGNV